jgi:hypothetical protein
MSPGAFGSAFFTMTIMALCLMAMAYPVYRVVCLWLDRAITGGELTIYLTVLVFLIVGVMATLGTPLGFFMILLLLATCCGVPLLNSYTDNASLRRMEDDDLAQAHAAIATHPANTYARERLARIYLKRRQYDEALQQVKGALDLQPKAPNFLQLHDRIETERRRALTHARVCPKCSTENPPDAGACLSCGFRFADPEDFLRLLFSESGQQATRWAGVAFGALGLLMLIFGVGKPAAAALFLFGIMCMALYLYARVTSRDR